jgi:hypothetical protein
MPHCRPQYQFLERAVHSYCQGEYLVGGDGGLSNTTLLLAAHFKAGTANESAAKMAAALVSDSIVPPLFTWEALALVTFALKNLFNILAMVLF